MFGNKMFGSGSDRERPKKKLKCSGCGSVEQEYNYGTPEDGLCIVVITGYGLYYDPPSGDFEYIFCQECAHKVASFLESETTSSNSFYDWALDPDMNEDFKQWRTELNW
jgi:ribosomal protein S27E